MSAFDNEAALAAFIRREFEESPFGVLIRQLQGRLRFGSGSPETVVTADPGVLYLDIDGGAGVTLYVKESNTDATGWVAK